MKFLGQEINRQDMGQITNAQLNPTHYADMLQDVLNRGLQQQTAQGLQAESNIEGAGYQAPKQGGANQ